MTNGLGGQADWHRQPRRVEASVCWLNPEYD
jgi:hypothetical protein